MIVNPKWGVWMSIGAAVVSVLLLCGAELTTLFGTTHTEKILAALGIANAIVNSINGVLHMIPASVPTTKSGAAEFALGPAAKS